MVSHALSKVEYLETTYLELGGGPHAVDWHLSIDVGIGFLTSPYLVGDLQQIKIVARCCEFTAESFVQDVFIGIHEEDNPVALRLPRLKLGQQVLTEQISWSCV